MLHDLNCEFFQNQGAGKCTCWVEKPLCQMNQEDNQKMEESIWANTPAASINDNSLAQPLVTDMLHADFGDIESMWNMRKWLQSALEAKGAKQTGAGMGMGEADIDIELEGHHFNVTIKPLNR